MDNSAPKGLSRNLGLLGLAATGICSMLGASVYVVPFMIQRNIPGIGPYVLAAFLLAAIPAILAALSYAILATAMPRAGGSYIYASRGLHPYLGFIGSFSQWFGLSIAVGVISYVTIPFIRDVAIALGFSNLGILLDTGWIRVSLALIMLWSFVGVNIRGVQFYERTLIPMMIVMFGLGAIVIITGLSFNHSDLEIALQTKENRSITLVDATFSWGTYLAAASLLFSSFIGFDSIAQAGGEAKNPGRTLPLAIIIAVLAVGGYYYLFTASVYHAVPWQFVAVEAVDKDVTAPGLLSYLLNPVWAAAIIAGAAIALINDLPAMLLSLSRLLFAWAEDRIFPQWIARIHNRWQTPHMAIVLSGAMASIGILGSHFAGDFFLGVDIMVTSMLVNYLLVCITVITLPRRNPALFNDIKVFRNRSIQLGIAISGVILLFALLVIHIMKDMRADVAAWYFHSTPVWIIVMAIATLLFFREYRRQQSLGIDMDATFNQLPPE